MKKPKGLEKTVEKHLEESDYSLVLDEKDYNSILNEIKDEPQKPVFTSEFQSNGTAQKPTVEDDIATTLSIARTVKKIAKKVKKSLEKTVKPFQMKSPEPIEEIKSDVETIENGEEHSEEAYRVTQLDEDEEGREDVYAEQFPYQEPYDQATDVGEDFETANLFLAEMNKKQTEYETKLRLKKEGYLIKEKWGRDIDMINRSKMPNIMEDWDKEHMKKPGIPRFYGKKLVGE